MKRAAILILLSMLSVSCLQTYNSSTSDPTRYGTGGGGDSSPGGQRFSAAYTIVRNECLGCHNHGFENFTTEQQFIDAGYAVAGQITQSLLYLSLRGNGIDGSRQDMPQGGALSATELTTIREWIEQIGM
ncbi:MAG TPA: hypothetical protein VFV50_03200 [Bdellovibrionales bacterium]|nr:hypothetical protein [Bdellovibrionales bacterium]